jgi:uncharacterized protein YdaU (DUF1376 family)
MAGSGATSTQLVKVNYFPFHIGDYAAHTGHLEPMEDLAYRRLLDLYYLREAPLPADIMVTAKLIRMRTMVDAVEAVLREFFELSESGWSHGRADEELNRMREKKDASEERDEHEKTRMQKHRERRSAMFAQLSEVGIYPAFNAKTGELEALIAANCTTPVTALVTPPVTGDVTAHVTAMVTHSIQDVSPVTTLATAIPTPTPTPTPTPKKKDIVSPSASPTDQGSRLPKDWSLPDDWKTWCEANRPDLEPSTVADQFRDFWISKPGKDGRKVDWLATWRNWCRSQKQGNRRVGHQETFV